MVKKAKPVNVVQVVSRVIKGYAFMRYPFQGFATPEDYRASVTTRVTQDLQALSLPEFQDKYESYLY